eukprot:188812-Alexandrium_andersonii.AAC.1
MGPLSEELIWGGPVGHRPKSAPHSRAPSARGASRRRHAGRPRWARSRGRHVAPCKGEECAGG